MRNILFAAAAVCLVPAAALAAHGKVGLWSSTTTVTMPGMQGMAPQTHTATYCMTAAQVNSDSPAGERNPSCTYQNIHIDGHAYSADMVCTGQLNATGHFSSTYDSDTHYTATVSIQTNGMAMTNQIDGKWLKADCAGAEH
ncbi:MAG: DUF3617 domain-containing protein [Rhizomicrobium sp.]